MVPVVNETLIAHRIATLRLRPDAPFPSEMAVQKGRVLQFAGRDRNPPTGTGPAADTTIPLNRERDCP